MIPDAVVCHRLDGRVRIRIGARRGAPGYFDRVAGALSALPGIDAVRTRPDSGSLLVEHRIPLKELAAHALAQGLFRLVREEPATDSVRARVQAALADTSHVLGRISDGTVSFHDLLFLLLLSFAIREAIHGHLAAPAATLMWYAFSTLSLPGDHVTTALPKG